MKLELVVPTVLLLMTGALGAMNAAQAAGDAVTSAMKPAVTSVAKGTENVMQLKPAPMPAAQKKTVAHKKMAVKHKPAPKKVVKVKKPAPVKK